MAGGNGKSGCFVLIVIGIIVSSVMTCTSRCRASSAISSYEKGDYEKAISKFEKIGIPDMSAVELYIYSELLKNKDSSEAENIKIKAHNKLIDSEFETKEFKEKMGDSTYQELLAWGKEFAKQQENKRIAKDYIGTWSITSIQDLNGKTVSESSIQSNTPVPVSINVRYDGTGFFKYSNGKTKSFTWSVANRKFFSKTDDGHELNIGINKQGLLVNRRAAIVYGTARLINAFYSKN